jgi:general secretion pathway protein D
LDVSSAAAQKSAATGNQAKTEGDKSQTGVEDLTKKAADQSNTGETKLGIQQDVKGGVLVLVGREKDVAEAKKRIEELDAAVSSLTNDTFVETYDTRFASARTILTFLKQAAPEVEVTVAPPTQTPGAFASTLSSGGATHATSGTPGDPAVGSTGGQVKQGTAPDPSGLGRIFDTDPSLGQQYDDSTRLVLKGRKSDVVAAIALLKKVDAKPKQVVVEVRIVDATPEAIEHTGLKYSWNQFTFYDSPKGTPVTTATGTTRPVGLGTISRVPATFNATLDAMVTHSEAKLLANPSMQVLNNQEANFFVGDQLSYPITSGGALGAQNVTVQTYNIGIGLNVRAHVNDDGNVTLRLNPIIQSLTGITNGLPQTSSREANTIVMIKDGESVVIGGLIRDQDTKTVQEIPYLSRLPIVGQLFRHTDRDHLKSNVIVTVTPHIVKDNLEPHP